MNKKSYRVCAALGSILAAMALTSCTSGNHATGSTDPVIYQMDYPSYDSLDSLYQHADLVIAGTIGGTSTVRQLRSDTGGGDPQLNPAAGTDDRQAAARDPLVISVFTVTVDRVFKGTAKPGDRVEVKQLGGQYDGVTYREQGLVSLKSGRYVLFLAVFPDSPASLLNPDQSQYPLDTAGVPTRVGSNTLNFAISDLATLSHGK